MSLNYLQRPGYEQCAKNSGIFEACSKPKLYFLFKSHSRPKIKFWWLRKYTIAFGLITAAALFIAFVVGRFSRSRNLAGTKWRWKLAGNTVFYFSRINTYQKNLQELRPLQASAGKKLPSSESQNPLALILQKYTCDNLPRPVNHSTIDGKISG